MDVSLYECYQGMRVQQQSLEVLGNNLSNMNTAGFKAETPFFKLLQNTLAGKSASYIESSARTNYDQGVLEITENPLDLAIEGKGFFCVKTPTGLAYTRDGTFKLDKQGYLVNQSGFRVQGAGGDIQMEQGQVEVDRMGNVTSSKVSVGVLKIVDFSDYSGVEKVGDNLFRPMDGKTKVVDGTNWEIRQGFKEVSNVSPASSMVEMISILRRFEMLQKAMSNLMNEVDRRSIDQVGRARP